MVNATQRAQALQQVGRVCSPSALLWGTSSAVEAALAQVARSSPQLYPSALVLAARNEALTQAQIAALMERGDLWVDVYLAANPAVGLEELRALLGRYAEDREALVVLGVGLLLREDAAALEALKTYGEIPEDPEAPALWLLTAAARGEYPREFAWMQALNHASGAKVPWPLKLREPMLPA